MHNGNLIITGGTGTFGTACLFYCLENDLFPKIIIFSRDEFKHHCLRIKLIKHFGITLVNQRVRFLIGDVRDKDRLMFAFRDADYLIHAAALKHVNLCEYNPQEAIRTNILGTENVVEAAIESNIQRAICLGTDKSVNPINLYGSTKLCLEKIAINGNFLSKNDGRTLFSVVRYGNVIASRGSVIPTLLDAYSKGDEFTITDPNMTRFWLTIQDAVDLCMFAFNNMLGREIFVPILKSMSMQDLVDSLAPGVRLKVVGVRPGEKIHESMISEHELPRTYIMNNYWYVILPEMFEGYLLKDDRYKNLSPVGISKYTSDIVNRFEKDEFKSIVLNAIKQNHE